MNQYCSNRHQLKLRWRFRFVRVLLASWRLLAREWRMQGVTQICHVVADVAVERSDTQYMSGTVSETTLSPCHFTGTQSAWCWCGGRGGVASKSEWNETVTYYFVRVLGVEGRACQPRRGTAIHRVRNVDKQKPCHALSLEFGRYFTYCWLP